MQNRQKVVLYGDSVVLAGIQASLNRYPLLEIIPMNTPTPDMAELCALCPNVVIFDLHAVCPEFHYELARKLPNILLLGIDTECNQVLLWSGQQLNELTTQNLVSLFS